jgi:hypothetical protein
MAGFLFKSVLVSGARVHLATRPYIDPRRIGVSPGAAAGATGRRPLGPKAPQAALPLSARGCGLRQPGLRLAARPFHTQVLGSTGSQPADAPSG